MAVIKPFQALRPVPEKARQVSCVPYDVVHEPEARKFIRENPLSFLKVTRPDAEFPEDEHPTAEAAFDLAKKELDWFVDERLLEREPAPSLYVYRLATGTHEQTGIVACCSLDEYERGLIKKHENVRPDKVEERTGHLLKLRAQTGLIFLTFRDTDAIRNLIAEAVKEPPMYDFICVEDIRQTMWLIRDTEAWVEAFSDVPALYIADGHHRVESANRARQILREQDAGHTGNEEYNFVLAGLFPAEDLQIMAYNRVVHDLNGLSEEGFLALISESFIVSETDEKVPQERREFCMYLAGKWYNLRFAVEFLVDPGPVANLDVSILQNYLLGPVLGIEDPRTDKRIGFVGGKRGTAELEKLVDEGEARVAFSLFPTTMDDLLLVSDMDEIMPPKSTWFEPKLKDGLLIHQI